jgi:hypothetical protein
MEAEVEALRAQISALQLQIEAARGRAERLRERAGHGLGGEHSSQGSEAGGLHACWARPALHTPRLMRALPHAALESAPALLGSALVFLMQCPCTLPAGKTHKGVASTSGSGSTAGAASGGGPATLEQLAAKVSEAYVRCGFDADASMGPLLMLANMETRVEVGCPARCPAWAPGANWPGPAVVGQFSLFSRQCHGRAHVSCCLPTALALPCRAQAYLAVVEALPQEYAEAAEKAREKARRQVGSAAARVPAVGRATSFPEAQHVNDHAAAGIIGCRRRTASALQVIRQEKLQAQQVEHEARVKRALERAAAPVFKKAGKPVMFRSRLFKKESVSSEQQQQQDDDDELEAFLARDML